jgi:hypothetical protein
MQMSKWHKFMYFITINMNNIGINLAQECNIALSHCSFPVVEFFFSIRAITWNEIKW